MILEGVAPSSFASACDRLVVRLNSFSIFYVLKMSRQQLKRIKCVWWTSFNDWWHSASKIKLVEHFSFEVAFNCWSWGTIFRSEVSSGAGRRTEGMIWTREMNFSKSSAELKTSNTITEAKLRAHSKFLTIRKRATLRISSKDISREESFFEAEDPQKEKRFLTGRKVAMDYLRVFQGRWRGRSCLGLQWKLKADLKNDNLQSFNNTQ